MHEQPGRWALAGALTMVVGLATSYAVAMVLTIRESPVVAVAELIIRITPGAVAEWLIDLVGQLDKPLLLLGIVVFLLAMGAFAGVLARTSTLKPLLVWLVLSAIGTGAVLVQPGANAVDVLPVVVGFVTWVVVLSAVTQPLVTARQRPELASRERRTFLVVAGVMGVAAIAIAGAGRFVGRGRRHVAESRRLLRLEGVTREPAPAATTVDLVGVSPWQTPNDDFYLIHTAISVPTIEPKDWSLRIHGLVDREVTLSFADLVSRRLTQAWITLGCVSNEVGSDLIGNAWWSGVRIADILAEVGLDPSADCVLQTSEDGWNCATPLTALTDDRNAMLAVAMNGRPLPIEHGFPVRTVVPGLYGYVSATKWVVDFEVTRFRDVAAFWTQRGWSEQGPVKISSRIDVPGDGDDVPVGALDVGGVAWAQHTGIAGVEVAVDGGEWQPATLGATPTDDSWVQWRLQVDLEEGDHELRVRAIDKDGLEQTGVRRDVLPDGATGWHTIQVGAVSG
ncbi:molybdopterin-dependent oxidoreductase [Nocardioides piscis]|uniref:Molybdopterin-dependent oxidoreductase n=1 Tax=Nocardioides piscis TaxID=2714938 RepID=A0A6G7YF89_9ACTN|nr:molybdopterin-dependent oxidoreductase [Nocardioides piscis]QIK75308.1 molybdopterin-dependent oxidoreductase [Nocardioides piscis]